MPGDWKILPCGHPAEAPSNLPDRKSQECALCKELKSVQRAYDDAQRRRREARGYNVGQAWIRPRIHTDNAERKRRRREAIFAAAKFAHYHERLQDLLEQCKYMIRNKESGAEAAASGASSSALGKRRRDYDEPELCSSVYERPPVKRPCRVDRLLGWGENDTSLRWFEQDPRFNLPANLQIEGQDDKARTQGELEKGVSQKAPDQGSKSVKRKYEYDEEEVDQPRKYQPKWVAALNPPIIHPVSRLKNGSGPKATSADHSNIAVRDREDNSKKRVSFDLSNEPSNWRKDSRRSAEYDAGRTQPHHPSRKNAMVVFFGSEQLAAYIIRKEEEARRRQEDERQGRLDLDALHKAWRKCRGKAGRTPWIGGLLPTARIRNGTRYLSMPKKQRTLLIRFC
ncbi:MAG: hypothetical protein M1821_000039 [Bathelium mastoideum]|nr:MAG: hypothetical protein M1821_000039 [Bathelium mastoideum]